MPLSSQQLSSRSSSPAGFSIASASTTLAPPSQASMLTSEETPAPKQTRARKKKEVKATETKEKKANVDECVVVEEKEKAWLHNKRALYTMNFTDISHHNIR